MNRAEKRRQQKLAQKAANKVSSAQSPSAQPVATTQQAIDQAVQHHSAGRLVEAEGLYQEILAADPHHPIALHLLGVLVHQVGKPDVAVELITKALSVEPNYPEARNNLGNALSDLGRREEAVASYRKAIAANPSYAQAHYNLGVAQKALGQLDDAVASYHKAITLKPDYAEAHANLGTALRALGQLDAAVASFGKALVIQPTFTEVLNNLGTAYQDLGQLHDAVAQYRKAIDSQPQFVEAYYNLGVALKDLGEREAAVESYRKAITLKPDHAEALNNLGSVLCDLAELNEAVACFEKAIAINPQYARAHNNLGLALLELGRVEEAPICHRRAIKIDPSKDMYWAGFSAAIENLSLSTVDDDLLQDLLGLLKRPTVSPSKVIQPVMSALSCYAPFLEAFKATGGACAYADIAKTLSEIPLFLVIIGLSPIHEVKFERMLVNLRRAMLDDVVAGNRDEACLPCSAALALQGFTNEYVFAEADPERVQLEGLEQQAAALAKQGAEVPPALLAALGAYRPLFSYPWAEGLADRAWEGPIADVIERQIVEPLKERALRLNIPSLTVIENEVSQSVREQYEENPYPRWVKTGLGEQGRPIDVVLEGAPLRFDLGDYTSPEAPEILIAGCGTGQQSLGAASKFANAQVLAVDLSLSSLSYAQRKTDELGMTNIAYAQADIMELASLKRQFDLIESCGVLHHMDDPLAGWRVLTDCLRPGGVMKIALYSEAARQDVVRGREMIAEKGYSSSVEDMRRCRQGIIEMAQDGNALMAETCNARDFYSLSECRDMLFHVQEHRFTLPQIETALEDLNLRFLGFELLNQDAMRAFKAAHPEPGALTSLSQWGDFERQNPDTFREMYQFWCRKK